MSSVSKLFGKVPQKLDELEPDNVKLYEVVVSPGSRLVGRYAPYLRRRSGYTLHLASGGPGRRTHS